MAGYPKIWFLRHGQTEWNQAFRLQGQLDSPLTLQGVADAERQGRIIAPILRENPQCLVSPLGRTLHTARIALAGHPFETDDRLMEIHAGAWQGRYRKDIMAEHPEWEVSPPSALEIYERAEKGEGLAGLHERVRSFLSDLSLPTVVVSHGLLGQVMRAEICGIPLKDAGHLSNRQGCVYLLEEGREIILEDIE